MLARRLADTGATVILLEAGGADRTRLVRQPGMIAIFHNVPALKKRLDWGYNTAPQAGALDRRIPQPRGRVLGGSGSINGMVFVRGNRQNYDDWAVPGWSYENVLSSFKRMEDWEDGATALRGSGGPVKVTRQKDLTPASQVFIDPGYLTEPDDTRLLLDGMEFVRTVMASPIIADQISAELSPGPAYPDRAALARELPNRATSCPGSRRPPNPIPIHPITPTGPCPQSMNVALYPKIGQNAALIGCRPGTTYCS